MVYRSIASGYDVCGRVDEECDCDPSDVLVFYDKAAEAAATAGSTELMEQV